MTAPSVHIDFASLADLRRDIGSDGFLELAQIVRQDLRDLAPRLEMAVAGRNETEARRAAHKLAGILMQYGFREVAEQALEAEMAPDATTLFNSAGHLAGLMPLVEKMFNDAASRLARPQDA